MTVQALGTLAHKEARALLPLATSTLVALAVAAALAAAAALGGRATPAGLLAFALGAAALGAWSIGHEYAERTLGPLLLAQPVDRTAILATKLAVLAAFLLILAGFAEIALPTSRQLAGSAPELPWFVPSVALSAVCLAPALTMLCRSAIGGAVFALAIPLVLWSGSYLWPTAPTPSAGIVPDDIVGTGLPSLTPAFTFVWFAGAALGWFLFARLEAFDGGWAPIAPISTAAGRPAAASGRRRRPLVALALKELRLQTMAFVVAALFAVVWLSVRYVKGDAMSGASPLLPALVLHGFVMSMLVGSLASAEERQLGMIDWQLLQPVGRRVQWAVKVIVALVTAVTLAIVLPGLLHWLWPPADRIGTRFWLAQPLVVMALTIVALYVSSASRSALAALLLSLPAIAALTLAVSSIAWLTNLLPVGSPGLSVAIWLVRRGWLTAGVSQAIGAAILVLCVAIAALPVVSCALRNHAGAPRSAWHYTKQAAWIGTGLAAAMLLFALAAPLTSLPFSSGPYGPAALWSDPPYHFRPPPRR
jgi:hypothetical protein